MRLWNEACEVYATLIGGGRLQAKPTNLFVRDGEAVFLQGYRIGWRVIITFTHDEIVMALGAEYYYQRSVHAAEEIRRSKIDEVLWGVGSYLTDQRLIIMTSRQTTSLWHRDLISVDSNFDEAGARVPDEFNVAYDGHRPQAIIGPASLRLAISLAWAAGGAGALHNPVFAPVAAAVSGDPR